MPSARAASCRTCHAESFSAPARLGPIVGRLESAERGRGAGANTHVLILQGAHERFDGVLVLEDAQRAGDDAPHFRVGIRQHRDEPLDGASGGHGIVHPCHGAGRVHAHGRARIAQGAHERRKRGAAEAAECACGFERR